MNNLRQWQRDCLRAAFRAVAKAPEVPSGLGPTASLPDYVRIAKYWAEVGPAVRDVLEPFLYEDAPRDEAEGAHADLIAALARVTQKEPQL